ncbi:RING-type domain-containing protein [Caenorhabditis elegans]|uniref:RING-type domain-containing protein n=1 Tax=Caenorhabditis elegans TaxID=6239 RepID=G5EEQ1_CAEEL|nr:RING-type domain-containing protein [Caenorhabditis elegans]CAE17838.2 RING-type domain-containing protein [Caenorhabditis elegans]|eukprot:NP_001024652.2 Uncharacterized protein CELE_F41E7.9 [Caenorhabditis elegans]
MVRTYAFNASSRSDIFEQYKHTASASRFNTDSSNTARSHDKASSKYINEDNRQYHPSEPQSISNSTTTTNSMTDSSSIGNQENNNQFMNNGFPPLNQSNIYQSSFHSSMIDPIGSIVGLRLLYMNGQLVYVPVEPHINLMINKQFGNPIQGASPPVILPQIQQHAPILAQNAIQPFQSMPQSPSQPNPLVRSQSKSDVYQTQNPYRQDSYSQPTQANMSRQSANQQYRQNTMNAKYGSLPNLAQKSGGLSSQEQHKLELQQQIEENKRRKEIEKQKEIELEQREIRKWEEYQKKIREEDDREKRQIQDKARAIELRNQQVYQKQQIQSQNRKNERRPSVPQYHQQQHQQQQHEYSQHSQNDSYDSYPESEEPIRPLQNMRNSNSFSESSQQRPISRPIRNQPRYDHQGVEPRPDSSQPRKVEWWEKKPSWQDRPADRQSAVIPTLRGKPPAVPDSQRSGYDSSGNVGEHQSRPSSRTTSSSQRSSDAHSEEPIGRNSSGARRAPEAFTITG